MDAIQFIGPPEKPRFPSPNDFAYRDCEERAERAQRRRRIETRAALACPRCGCRGYVVSGYRCESCGHSSGVR